MKFTIVKAEERDLKTILQLFEEAIQYQKLKNYIGWSSIDEHFIKEDIRKKFLFKVLVQQDVAGIFSICYRDNLIWREKERGDAIYLHRIVANRRFEGVKLFKVVSDWAVEHARALGLKYVRMDTWAQNSKIIDYYATFGFIFIETYTTADTDELPVQHRNLNVALLEMEIL